MSGEGLPLGADLIIFKIDLVLFYNTLTNIFDFLILLACAAVNKLESNIQPSIILGKFLLIYISANDSIFLNLVRKEDPLEEKTSLKRKHPPGDRINAKT